MMVVPAYCEALPDGNLKPTSEESPLKCILFESGPIRTLVCLRMELACEETNHNVYTTHLGDYQTWK